MVHTKQPEESLSLDSPSLLSGFPVLGQVHICGVREELLQGVDLSVVAQVVDEQLLGGPRASTSVPSTTTCTCRHKCTIMQSTQVILNQWNLLRLKDSGKKNPCTQYEPIAHFPTMYNAGTV